MRNESFENIGKILGKYFCSQMSNYIMEQGIDNGTGNRE
jgi:hypothetical protein